MSTLRSGHEGPGGVTKASAVERILRHLGRFDRTAPASFDAVVSCLAFSELSPGEQRFTLEAARTLLEPGGILVVADEVLPDTAAGRAAHRLIRWPLAVLTGC